VLVREGGERKEGSCVLRDSISLGVSDSSHPHTSAHANCICLNTWLLLFNSVPQTQLLPSPKVGDAPAPYTAPSGCLWVCCSVLQCAVVLCDMVGCRLYKHARFASLQGKLESRPTVTRLHSRDASSLCCSRDVHVCLLCVRVASCNVARVANITHYLPFVANLRTNL